MKSFKSFLLVAALIIFTTAGTSGKSTYVLSKDYTVTIHGTSNLHDWDEKVTTVSGESDINRNSDGSFDLNSMSIKMEVHSIKSTEGGIMNNNTYKALKADDHPEITFVLSNLVKSIPAGTHTVSARINLTIAGVTNAVDIAVTTTAQTGGNLVFEGSKTMNMTDYGITPPVALFGTLKTGNAITINFKINLVPTTNL